MIRLFAVLLLLTLLGCATGDEPQSMRSPDADPRQWSTFQWYEDDAAVTREKQAREVAAVVRQAAVESFQAKGYRKTGDSPDLLVRHHVMLEMRPEVIEGRRKPGDSWMNPPWEDAPGIRDVGGRTTGPRAGESADQQVVEMPAGTLVIDVLDRDGEVVWRGWHESAVDLLAVAQPELATIVHQILARFPE